MIYYISDLHLADERIFKLCRRPFSSLAEYETKLIDNWNSKVTENDDVYVLGDLATGSAEIIKRFFSKVRGRKHLIVGNHDEEYLNEYILTESFVGVDRLRYINDVGRKVCVCHYPIMDWFSGNEIICHVYGHIHNKNSENSGYMYEQISNYYKDKPAFNASVDVTNFEPVTLDELIALKEDKQHETYLN